jgi:hypothetical protein
VIREAGDYRLETGDRKPKAESRKPLKLKKYNIAYRTEEINFNE